MSSFRGVILDVDGTLVDSNDAHAHAWMEALTEQGYTVAFARIRELIGMGGDNLLPLACNIEKDSPEGEQASQRRAEIFEHHYLPTIKAFPQVRALLQQMRDSGLRLAVASSAEDGELDTLLAIAGVQDLLEEQTSSSDASSSKPDPDILQAALAKLNLGPDEVVMLGDTPYDIQSAQKAGVATIALRCGGWNDQQLDGALAIYADPADLLAHYADAPLA